MKVEGLVSSARLLIKKSVSLAFTLAECFLLVHKSSHAIQGAKANAKQYEYCWL